jgi:hypothetical protein
MRVSKEFLKTMAVSGDIFNLISGGMSEPQIKLVPLVNAHQVEVKVPGVKPRNLAIEIKHNQLVVWQIIDVKSTDHIVKAPRLIFKNAIPHFINIPGIEARAESDKLLIQLPFNERADGYHRKVRIREV